MQPNSCSETINNSQEESKTLVSDTNGFQYKLVAEFLHSHFNYDLDDPSPKKRIFLYGRSIASNDKYFSCKTDNKNLSVTSKENNMYF